MKNVHLLPTDNYKQDYTLQSGEVVEVVKLKQLIVNKETGELSVNKNPQWSASCDTDVLVPHNIYITNDEEIKEGDWFIANNGVHKCIRVDNNTSCPFITLNSKKEEIGHFKTWRTRIILTTDKNLIKDGVQAIDDEFLEWFVKNPSCEEVEIREGVRYEDEWIDNEDGGEIYQHQYCCYKIIIPKEEPKQETLGIDGQTFKIVLDKDWFPKKETLETIAERRALNVGIHKNIAPKEEEQFVNGFIEGAQWQAKRMYSEEEVKDILFEYQHYLTSTDDRDADEWFTQFKK